jgi:hypothetical protein
MATKLARLTAATHRGTVPLSFIDNFIFNPPSPIRGRDYQTSLNGTFAVSRREAWSQDGFFSAVLIHWCASICHNPERFFTQGGFFD